MTVRAAPSPRVVTGWCDWLSGNIGASNRQVVRAAFQVITVEAGLLLGSGPSDVGHPDQATETRRDNGMWPV